MTKRIIITESQAKTVINELFAQRLIQELIDKFKQEQPGLDDNTALFYINRFQQIKDSPKVQNKDIMSYSWENLKELVDLNQPDDIKIEGGDKLIYNQNNLKIYEGHSKQACIKYGTGYNFCISSRGADNLYDQYRFGEDELYNLNTIYFVVDEDKTKESNKQGFVDPNHLLVIMAQKKPFQYQGKTRYIIEYVVTDADNEGPQRFIYFSDIVEKLQPKLDGLLDLFKFVKPHPIEQQLFDLKKTYNKKLMDMFQGSKIEWNPNTGIVPFSDIKHIKHSLEIIDNYLNNKPCFVYSIDVGETHPISDTFSKKIDTAKWLEHLNTDLSYDVYPEDENEVDITPIIPNDPKYLEYIKQVKKVFMDYLHDKNKLNYS